MKHPASIAILDFGGQYAHLIASRIRRMGAFSEIFEPEVSPEALKHCAGIILSGGPQSVYDAGSPQADKGILELGIPVLGLCYGHQWLAHALGGEVQPGKVKEYGDTGVRVVGKNLLFEGLPKDLTVWMSHGDEVAELPEGFTTIASTDNCTNAAMSDESRKFYGIQWHIEVTHSQHGMDLLERFVKLCKPSKWSIESYAKHVGAELKKVVGDKKVFMLVSGGVDSSVAFTLLNQVLGTDRVQGLLVDTGLMRKNEVALIKDAFDALGIKNLHIEDASEEFFAALKNAYDPETKRKAIGDTFLAVQRRVSREMGLVVDNEQPETSNWLLGQGTIYPDTIETGGTKHASHIKTHHNRVEAIRKMMEAGLVVEPLKDLYKDEVRRLGEELGLPHDLVWRHPFPGPGLGVRILCAKGADADVTYDEKVLGGLVGELPFSVLPVKTVGVQGDGRTYRHALALYKAKPWSEHANLKSLATKIPNAVAAFNRVLLCTSHEKPVSFVFTPGVLTRERADLLREADEVVNQVMRQHGLYESIWQFPVALLPFGTKKGHQSVVLRPVSSTDAMTAHAMLLPDDVLQLMNDRILKEVPGIDCVFLDMTNKPPGTIEWE
jgi:GMP synthase (glutamine-hydrolysing)